MNFVSLCSSLSLNLLAHFSLQTGLHGTLMISAILHYKGWLYLLATISLLHDKWEYIFMYRNFSASVSIKKSNIIEAVHFCNVFVVKVITQYLIWTYSHLLHASRRISLPIPFMIFHSSLNIVCISSMRPTCWLLLPKQIILACCLRAITHSVGCTCRDGASCVCIEASLVTSKEGKIGMKRKENENFRVRKLREMSLVSFRRKK